jgi:hypothetical protein
MWMFWGSRTWSQWGVVHRFHVLLACRKFWFSNIIEMHDQLKANHPGLDRHSLHNIATGRAKKSRRHERVPRCYGDFE